jgi:hypothetical protein
MKKVFFHALIGLLWIAANVPLIFLVWLLWPRLGTAKADAGGFSETLFFDFLVALILPLQHSIWTQTPVKRALVRSLGAHYERPIFVLASGIAVAVTPLFWRCTDRALFSWPAGALWPMRAAFVATLAIQLHASNVVGAKFLMGIPHLKSKLHGKPLRDPVFKERGLYRWVRHPIAMSQLLMVWIAGTYYADRVLLAVVWTVWIILATALEDRRLAREFGDAYAAYRRRTGFLWPRWSGSMNRV